MIRNKFAGLLLLLVNLKLTIETFHSNQGIIHLPLSTRSKPTDKGIHTTPMGVCPLNKLESLVKMKNRTSQSLEVHPQADHGAKYLFEL